jgi:hypothetical protein
MWVKAWSEVAWGDRGRALAGLVLDNADMLFAPPPSTVSNSQPPQTAGEFEKIKGAESGAASELLGLLSRIHHLASHLRTVVVSDRVGDLPDDSDSATNYTVARVGPLEAAPARELLATLAPSIEAAGVADAIVAECGGFPVALRAVAQTVANGSAMPAEILDALSAAAPPNPAAVVTVCMKVYHSSSSTGGSEWVLSRLLPLTLLPGTFSADAAAAVLNSSLSPAVDASAAEQRVTETAATLRRLSLRGLLQEASAIDGRQRWRMPCAVRLAVEAVLRTSSGGDGSISDFVAERNALARLLSSTATAAQRLFHERAAGWVGGALFEPVASLVDPVVEWLASGVVEAPVRSELSGVTTSCRALLTCELPRRQHRELAEAVAKAVGSGHAKLGAAWAMSREGKVELSAARALAGQPHVLSTAFFYSPLSKQPH